MVKFYFLLGIFLLAISANGQSKLSVEGTRFLLDDQPFPFTGVSFFNAIYNSEFGKDRDKRLLWMDKFKSYGINVFRIWAQWDNTRGFVDACPTCSLYDLEGNLRSEHMEVLQNILTDAAEKDIVIELALFSFESLANYKSMGNQHADMVVKKITEALIPYRNLSFQIWNEYSERVLDYAEIVRSVDPNRLITNAPGFAGRLGAPEQNNVMNYLSPHTTRQWVGRHWEVAPREIDYLLYRYKKPVVDDEPARNGTSHFGGPNAPTSPFDQIAQILAVWQIGGYVVYHHDMFQLGNDASTIPPSGVPDPEFNPYHHTVFRLLADSERYMH